MRRPDCPCYECPRRHILCHAECEDYKTWLKPIEEQRKQKRNESEFAGYRADRQIKIRHKAKGKLKRNH